MFKESPKAEKLALADKIINLAIGEDACRVSRVRLARKHSVEQLKDLLFLLESF